MPKRVILYPIVVFLSIIAIGFYLEQKAVKRQQEAQERALAVATASLAQNLQQQLASTLSSTSMLETLLRLADYRVHDFGVWGQEVLAANPGLNCVQLAPNGVVTYVYPLAGHEKAIGHDLLKDPRRRVAAMAAIHDRRLTLVGPLRLIQNDRLAFIARKPIMKSVNGAEEFWGFSIALIDAENFVSKVLKPLNLDGIAYRIEGRDPDVSSSTLIAKSKMDVGPDAHVFSIDVPNGQWILSMEYIKVAFCSQRYAVYVGIVVLALIFAVVVFRKERLSHRQSLALATVNRELETLAKTDSLTKISNRRSLLSSAEALFHLAKRSGRPMSVVMLDLDNFKAINDAYGHQAGDAALVHFASLVRDEVRFSDLAARWGGEEFLIVLPETRAAGAEKVASMLQDKLRSSPLEYEGFTIPYTVSIGIAELTGEDVASDLTLMHLINQSDAAMYAAKSSGRDCIKIYSEKTE